MIVVTAYLLYLGISIPIPITMEVSALEIMTNDKGHFYERSVTIQGTYRINIFRQFHEFWGTIKIDEYSDTHGWMVPLVFQKSTLGGGQSYVARLSYPSIPEPRDIKIHRDGVITYSIEVTYNSEVSTSTYGHFGDVRAGFCFHEPIIIELMSSSDSTGHHDYHVIVLGVTTREEAIAAVLHHYPLLHIE